MKNNIQNEEYVIWTDELSIDDISILQIMMLDFRDERISYKDFTTNIERMGYDIEPIFENDIKLRTKAMEEAFNNRLKNNELTYFDIKAFYLKDKMDRPNLSGIKIMMETNYRSIELAAEKGDKRAQNVLLATKKIEYNVLHGHLPSSKINNNEDFKMYVSDPELYIKTFKKEHSKKY